MSNATSEAGKGARGETESHVPYLRQAHTHPGGMDGRAGRPASLLGEAPRCHAARKKDRQVRVVSEEVREPDLGDLVVVLLASTLAGLRDRLAADGFDPAAELVADLVEITDDYLTGVPA